ncbi:hypothetical protein LY76DRAFT_403834 [Colletotrichum caudatum]|nr:hypothetical protein LY76DRAFT_403834 [Colletotrichum caudatum]
MDGLSVQLMAINNQIYDLAANISEDRKQQMKQIENLEAALNKIENSVGFLSDHVQTEEGAGMEIADSTRPRK